MLCPYGSPQRVGRATLSTRTTPLSPTEPLFVPHCHSCSSLASYCCGCSKQTWTLAPVTRTACVSSSWFIFAFFIPAKRREPMVLLSCAPKKLLNTRNLICWGCLGEVFLEVQAAELRQAPPGTSPCSGAWSHLWPRNPSPAASAWEQPSLGCPCHHCHCSNGPFPSLKG